MKFYRTSALILACTCLAGCDMKVVGNTANVPVNAGQIVCENDKHLGTIMQEFSVPTAVILEVDKFLNFIDKKDWKGALNELGYTSGELLSESDVKTWASEHLAGVKVTSKTEQGTGNKKTVRLELTDGEPILLSMCKINSLWKIKLPDFVLENAKFQVPQGYSVKLGKIDLKKHRGETTTDGLDVFTLPVVSKYSHTFTLGNTFTSAIQCDLILPEGVVGDFTSVLAVNEPLRGQAVKAVGTLIETVTSGIISNKYTTFKSAFDSSVDLSVFDTTYKRGVEARSVLDSFQLVECKDIKASEADVIFSGFDKIKLSVGTSWKWATVVDDAKTWKSMNLITVAELRYVNKTWKLISLDDGTLTKVSDGTLEWN